MFNIGMNDNSLIPRYIAAVAVFAALQAAVQLSMGPWLIIPGVPASTLPFLAFPCALVAAVTYAAVRMKMGAVGLSLLIGGFLAFMVVAFWPVLFQFIVAALIAEIYITITKIFHVNANKPFFFILGGIIMFGRALGFMLGVYVFLPFAFERFITLESLSLFFSWAIALSFIVGGLGGLAGYRISKRVIK